MGVDVEMAVWTSDELSDERILDLSYRAVEANGKDLFWLNRADGRHAFSRIDPTSSEDCYYELEGLNTLKGGTFLKMNTLCRYYGIGYERGPFPQFFAFWHWLRANLKDCIIWYGGDSGVGLDRLEIEQVFELLWHWTKVGYQPYRGYPGSSRLGKSALVIPECKLCKRGMIRYGWGGAGPNEFAAVSCPCGAAMDTHDGGRTWTDKSKDN